MSEPTPDQPQGSEQQSGRRRASAAAEGVNAAPAVLTVGHFPHRDRLLGGERERLGVVVAAGDTLEVIPLEHYRVHVDPAEFVPLAADDL
jgi:hypothetical protein